MKSDIPLICRRLSQAGLIAGSEGNVSEKRGGQIIITPSQMNKSEIQTCDLLIINQKGESSAKFYRQASSEKFMHLSIYKAQQKARAIIHAHPPFAVALSLARPDWKFLPPALPEILVMLGEVPLVPYIRPGTKQLGKTLQSFVKKSKALILSHHGAVVWAENISKAFLLMEQLESCCKILALAESMGGAKKLSQSEIKKLL